MAMGRWAAGKQPRPDRFAIPILPTVLRKTTKKNCWTWSVTYRIFKTSRIKGENITPTRTLSWKHKNIWRISYISLILIYRVNIKSFPDYKHSLQENCVEYKHIFFFQNITQLKKLFLQHISTLQHMLLLLHGGRLIDCQFLSTCSPTCLQLL